MYSAPSIVMQTRGHDGSLHIFDDFREGYAWLRYNTPDDAIIASWCAHTLPTQQEMGHARCWCTPNPNCRAANLGSPG